MRAHAITAEDRSRWPIWAAAMILLCAGVLQLGYAQLHGDISWLLIVGERVLGGDELYRDVFEVNPPFSVWLYLPWAWLEKHTVVPAETFTKLALFAVFAMATLLSREVLARTRWLDGAVEMGIFPVAALLIFGLPSVFAQREHFGIIAFLPFLALLCARANDGPSVAMPTWIPVACGIAVSVIVCVKPHYVLAVLLPISVLAVRQRSLRPLLAVENLVAAAIVMAYAATTWLAYPAYLSEALPVVFELYQGTAAGMLNALAAAVAVLGPVLVIAVTLSRRAGPSPVFEIVFAAAGGFLVAFVVQGRGWDYHLLPAFVTAGLALYVAWRSAAPSGRLAVIYLLVASVPMLAYGLKSARDGTQYTPELAALDRLPRGASIVAMTQHLKLVHPAVRYMNGQWISRDATDWIVGLAERRLEELPAGDPRRVGIERHLLHAIDRKAADLAKKPDLVMAVPADEKVYDTFMADPRIAAAMKDYCLEMTAGPMEILRRCTSG